MGVKMMEVGLVDPEAQETTTTGATLILLWPRVHVAEALEYAGCGGD